MLLVPLFQIPPCHPQWRNLSAALKNAAGRWKGGSLAPGYSLHKPHPKVSIPVHYSLPSGPRVFPVFILFLSEQEVFLEIPQKFDILLLSQGTLALGVNPTPPQLQDGTQGQSKKPSSQGLSIWPSGGAPPWACLPSSAPLKTITCSRKQQKTLAGIV